MNRLKRLSLGLAAALLTVSLGACGGATPPGCTQPDPTGGLCISVKMEKVVEKAEAAGFTTLHNCFADRKGKSEHPKGRACDWEMGRIGVEAKGADKKRGAKMAKWAVKNAKSLDIIYVIWFRQIWTPGQGWHAYTARSGHNNPSGWHTDHVHISVEE